jgi:flagellar protein FlgJ
MTDFQPLGKIGAWPLATVTKAHRPASGSPSTDAAGTRKPAAQLDQACQDLESLFVYYLLKEMRASIPDAGLLTADKSKDVYTSIMDAEMAQQLAKGRGLGLAAMLRQQLAGIAAPSDADGHPGPKTAKGFEK